MPEVHFVAEAPLPTSKSHGTAMGIHAMVARGGAPLAKVDHPKHNIMGRSLNVNQARAHATAAGTILAHNMLLSDNRRSPEFS